MSAYVRYVVLFRGGVVGISNKRERDLYIYMRVGHKGHKALPATEGHR